MSPIKALVALTLSLGVATATIAAPNFLGPTGLLLTPTAGALQQDEYNVSVHAFESASAEYAANYGLRPNLEVGFTRLPDNDTIINAKYNFLPEKPNTIGASAGIMDFTDQQHTTLYLVGSKTIPTSDLYWVDHLSVNLGIAGGDDEDTIRLNGLFGGLSVGFGKRFSIMGDYDGNAVSYGARMDFGRGIIGQAGVAGGDDNSFVIGLSYNGKL